MAFSRREVLETPRRRRIRRRRRIIKTIFWLVFIVFILLGVIWASRIDNLQVANIEIEGNETIERDRILNIAKEEVAGYYLALFPKSNFLFFPSEKISARLMDEIKEIGEAEVNKISVNSAKITIIERKSAAIFCGFSCYFADENGFIFNPVGIVMDDSLLTIKDDSQVISVGSSPLEQDSFKNLLLLSDKIEGLGFYIQAAALQPEKIVWIETAEGRIIVSLRQSVEEQFSSLQTAISEPTFRNADGSIKSFNYIDLRFGNKVFYKMI